MSSPSINLLTAEGDHLTAPDRNADKDRQWRAHLAQVTEQFAERYASNPLWTSRLDRSQPCFNQFSPGRVLLTKPAD